MFQRFRRATISVSPFMGEWIEIVPLLSALVKDTVSPFMGEWIEIDSF